MRRRRVLAALPVAASLSGCFTVIPVQSPDDGERGELVFESSNGRSRTAAVAVTRGDEALLEETVSFGDADGVGRASFTFPDDADCEVRATLDGGVSDLDFGEKVRSDDWHLDDGAVVGTVDTLSCDKTYAFAVDGDAVALSRTVHCV